MISDLELPIAGRILLGSLVAVAAAYDIRYRRIPNWLVLAGIIAGLLWNTLFAQGVASFDAAGLGRSAAGFGLGFLLYFPLYLLRARGAGDVKLLAAAGAIVGPTNCFWLFLLTAILGGVIALVFVALKGRMRKTLFNAQWILSDLMRFKAPHKSSEELDVNSSKGMRLPHGAMIAVGSLALIVMLQWHLKF
jgi:prepilin peptidase CpaA